jgi:hypothetical protein
MIKHKVNPEDVKGGFMNKRIAALEQALVSIRHHDRTFSGLANPKTGWLSDELCEAYMVLSEMHREEIARDDGAQED